MFGSIQRIRTVPSLPPREPSAHKGTYGRVLVIGGSIGMSGAPAMAGMAALRSGAGLVSVAVPRSVQPVVAGYSPCIMTVPLPEDAFGRMEPAGARKLLKQQGLLGPQKGEGGRTALVVGPGLGRGDGKFDRELWKLIDAFREAGAPVVVDADALNAAGTAGDKSGQDWSRQPHPRTVITPHPGEMARLHGVTTREIQSDREGFAVRTARMMAAGEKLDVPPVVVLKGQATVVTDGVRLYLNPTGNPGMATGGTGDVLSGVIGGLLAQGLEPFEAATLGVHVHGLAGDLAAAAIGLVSLIATDLLDDLPRAFQTLSRRRGR